MKPLALLALAACGGGFVESRNTHRVTYPNGYARFEFALRDGLPNGRGRAWYPSGALQLEGTYVDGARHGRFWFFTENGNLEYQALFYDNAEVWRSADPAVDPPAEWDVAVVGGEAPPAPRKAERVTSDDVKRWFVRSKAPEPAFASLDRITMHRGQVQIGIGGAGDLEFGSVVRVDAFGHYQASRFGGYAQLSQTQLEGPMSTLSGRRTFELGGTARYASVTSRIGLLVPVGNDDTEGFIASTAGVAQRPADAAASFASSVAARTSTSFVRTGERSVLQFDAGIDWLFGTEVRPLDVLLRANAGVGVGTRRAQLTLELSNTFRPSEATRLHAIVVGGTASFAKLWFGASLSITHQADTSLLTSVGYDM